MTTRFIITQLLVVVILINACSIDRQQTTYSLKHLSTPVNTSLRGLSALDELTVWISGSSGTFIRTIDGGLTWQYGSFVDSVDFRDIHAFDKDRAIMISAGTPALIYKTTDGGINWSLKYKNEDDRIFFDALDFWDQSNGIAFSDAIDGRFFMITTIDGGETWSQLLSAPAALENEGGFAASGTNMITFGVNEIWVGTTSGRILHSSDRGISWVEEMSPLENINNSSAGIFSLALSENGLGIMVGGDYLKPDDRTKNAALLVNNHWVLISDLQPMGYRSGVAFIPGSNTLITTGPTGTDISFDNGSSWALLDSIGYHAVSFNKTNTSGWLSGSEGRVAKVVIQ